MYGFASVRMNLLELILIFIKLLIFSHNLFEGASFVRDAHDPLLGSRGLEGVLLLKYLVIYWILVLEKLVGR